MRRFTSFPVAVAVIGTVFMAAQARATELFVLDTTLLDITYTSQPRLQYHRIRTFESVLNEQLDEGRAERSSDRSRSTLFGDRKGAGTADNFGTGLSAGTVDDYFPNLAVWSSYSFSDFEDDHPTTAMDGNSNSVFFGFDSQPIDDKTILGFSFGYDRTDTDSPVNAGSSETKSYTVSPYAVYIINDNFDVDAAIGFTTSDNDSVRRVGGLPTGAPITSESDTKTLFGSVNVNYTRWMGNWNVTASTGVSRSHATTDDYVDSVGTPIPSQSSTLNTISVRGKVMYYWEKAQPYASVRFDYDNVMDDVDIGAGQVAPSNDSTGFALGGGVNFKITDTISGGASLEYTLGREDFDNLLASVNLRWALN